MKKELGKRKKLFKILSVIIVIILILVIIKSCNSKEKIKDAKEYQTYLKENLKNIDQSLSEFEKWLLGIEIDENCSPEVIEGFKYYGEKLIKISQEYHKKEYIGKEEIPNYKEYLEYFKQVNKMGKEMVELSKSKTPEDMKNQLDKIIETQEKMKDQRKRIK